MVHFQEHLLTSHLSPSLPSSPLCFDNFVKVVIWLFYVWHITGNKYLFIGLFSPQDSKLLESKNCVLLILCSQLLSLTLHWSLFHKHLMNESTFSLNSHTEWWELTTLQGSHPFSTGSCVKIRLINLLFLFVISTTHPLYPLFLLRKNT
jgi:hypothetical protein